LTCTVPTRAPGTYAANCILARRLAERGVRFIQLYHMGWDHHEGVPRQLPPQCLDTDQPSAALVQDLKQRGMLDDTLVIWGGEFGRTVYCQGNLSPENYGRDHHPRCFTVWLAGGGIKAGISYGCTDDYCYNITEKGCRVVRDTYEDRASVGEQVIDPIRDRDADGIGAEIVIIDAHRRAIPLGAIVLEVADEFSFFGIDTDNGKPLTLKAGTQRRDVSELLVAVRARVSGYGFAVHAQGKIHIVKQPRHSTGRDLDIELAKQFGDSGRRLVGPSNAGDGIAGGVVFQ
jgi:hypothetical protein